MLFYKLSGPFEFTNAYTNILFPCIILDYKPHDIISKNYNICLSTFLSICNLNDTTMLVPGNKSFKNDCK